MSDDLKRRVPEDPTKINVNQQWELDYWTKELGVPEETLISIVSLVGPMVAKVRIEIYKGREI